MTTSKHLVLGIFFSYLVGFTLYDDLIPLHFNSIDIERPFFGGFNRPKIQWTDWDVDDDIDLFVLDASGYLRYIDNKGNSNVPDFHLVNTEFQEIYCGSWFRFADYDGDGDVDLCTQNSENPNQISFYANSNGQLLYIGKLTTSVGDFVLSSSVMTPTFADIDNDGDEDFFTGNSIGTLTFYENIGISNGMPQFEYITNIWQNIYIVGGIRSEDRHGASAITFIDLDGDGDLDLSWGDFFQQSLYIIWNSGTASEPEMIEVTSEYPPKNPIVSAGQNMPTFADIDNDGDNDLFVTVLSGAFGNDLVDNFFYYENIGSHQDPVYDYRSNNYFSIVDIHSNSSPEFVDIDMDGDLDLFLSNQKDLTLNPSIGKIFFFRNVGTNKNPIYVEEHTSLLSENMGQMLSPAFGDLDGDGDRDLFVGDFNGFIKFYENVTNGNDLTFSFRENVENIDLSGNAAPTLGDIDGDGDLDLLIGQLNGSLSYFQNIGGSSKYQFEQDVSAFTDIQAVSNSAPEFIDINKDGIIDLFLGTGNQGTLFYNNIGTFNSFQFSLDESINIPLLGVNTKPAVGFLFDARKIDIIVGVSTGGLYHLQGECVSIGDLNYDGNWDVLDIVGLANCVLAANCEINFGCAGDLSDDGLFNVIDIVALANCVLSNTCD